MNAVKKIVMSPAFATVYYARAKSVLSLAMKTRPLGVAWILQLARGRMADAARSLARPDAAERVADLVEQHARAGR